MIFPVSQVRRGCGFNREPQHLVGCRANFMGILGLYWERLERFREDVPVLQPVHSASSPQARESDHTPEAAPTVSISLIEEDGGIKPRRAHTRLTVYKAVSTLNGLRLPHQSACASSRRHRRNLKARARVERAILTLQWRAPYRLATGPFRCNTTIVECCLG